MTDPTETKRASDSVPPIRDGATLEMSGESNEPLPFGMVRLRSGMIAVTELYCPNGHNLVDPAQDARFNGYAGIALMVEGRGKKGKIILSPIHGDDSKFGESDFEPGEVCRLSCPICGVELPAIQACGCAPGSKLVGLYFEPTGRVGNQVAICNTWGCLRSRIMDRFQVISRYE